MNRAKPRSWESVKPADLHNVEAQISNKPAACQSFQSLLNALSSHAIFKAFI